MKKSVYILVISAFVSIAVVICQNAILKVSTSNIINADEPVIIIDAGHGGLDGGAIGIDGTAEKDINLSIAIKLNEIISSYGYKTRMVRIEDISVHDTDADTVREKKVSDIHNRTALMDEYKNCIYVSIHQNKYESGSIWGAQTFYSPNDESSKILADFIQKSIVQNIQPNNKRVIKPSGTSIYVLYNATKPAVMVECGFLSNANELSQLKDENYQTQIAYSISYGIMNYFISEVSNGAEV